MAKSASPVEPVWEMSLPFPGLPHGSILEDVSSHGTMLLRYGRYNLILWKPGAIKPSAEFSLPAWPRKAQELSASTTCKFSSGEKRVVCAHGSWLALEDVTANKEIRHVTGTQDFSGLNWDDAKATVSGKVTLLMLSSPVVVAVGPKEGRVAVAYNTLKKPKILVFSPDLRTQMQSWQVVKYVQSLFWSPDGKHLGVLYYIPNDKPGDSRRKRTGWLPSRHLTRVPDVSVFDISSGKELLSFATSGIEANAAFSPDGKLVYVITRFGTIAGYGRGGTSDTLRAFASTTGKLVRTFKVGGTGVRNNFAVSPDGRFIAADCTKDTHSGWYYLLRMRENLGGDITQGFVVLDVRSGRVIFREAQRMFGNFPMTVPLFFSANSDRLFTELGNPPNRLVVYSIPR